MNYPLPNDVSGSRSDLIKSYKQVISKNRDANFPIDSNNCFRICVYNVYQFRFLYNSNKNIYDFIKKIKPDYLSLIEYNNYPLDKYFCNLNFHSVFLEQLKDYGILSITHHKPSISKKKYIQSGIEEKSGFTHSYIAGLNIITIHLDVYDESGTTRLYEIMEIHEYVVTNSLENVIIIGDFNEMDVKSEHPLYKEYLDEFRERTNYKNFSTRVHDILRKLRYINVYDLFENDEIPKFSCWSGKLVDYCYIWQPTWNSNYKIFDINMPMIPFSDHLPIVLDIKLPNNTNSAL